MLGAGGTGLRTQTPITWHVWKRILTYLVITFALSSVFYYQVITNGSLDAAGGLYVLGLMWSPGLAALATRLIYQHNLRGIGWRWGKTRYQLVSYLLPLMYVTALYLVIWLTGIGGFYNKTTLARMAMQLGLTGLAPGMQIILALLATGTVIFLVAAVSALGEELGWRGLLVPELAQVTTFTQTALISGIIWFIYHAPLIIAADYNTGAPAWYSLLNFAVGLIGINFAFTWLRLRSGSVWTGVLLHANYNALLQRFFDPLTVQYGVTKYVTGEFGVGIAIVGIIIAIVFWRRRSALSEAEAP